MLVALFLLGAAGCAVTVEDRGYVVPPPLPPMEQLEQAALVDPDDYTGGTDGVVSFITEDRTVACSLTAARGPHINLPYEQNSSSDNENNKLAIVPVAHCQLAKYPPPQVNDVADDCAGTNLGYLGGVALLTPDAARYGECRSGVTQMEAAYGPWGSKAGPLAQLQVLAHGKTSNATGCAALPTTAVWRAETYLPASVSSCRRIITN